MYDCGLSLALVLGRSWLAAAFGVPAPVPPLHADLNALFTAAIGIGYVLPWRDPVRYRAYLWIMGPLLKGGGAVLFVLDVAWRGSPAAYLLFAAADGSLALATLLVLLASRGGSSRVERRGDRRSRRYDGG
ncbi:MAG: hypothetical protein AB1806_14375 [Acidobacteriota bacterium]